MFINLNLLSFRMSCTLRNSHATTQCSRPVQYIYFFNRKRQEGQYACYKKTNILDLSQVAVDTLGFKTTQCLFRIRLQSSFFAIAEAS